MFDTDSCDPCSHFHRLGRCPGGGSGYRDAQVNACTPAPVAAAAKQTGITAAAPPLTTPGALRRRGRLQCMAVQTQPETPVAAAEQLPRAALCTYAEEVAKEDGCTVDDLYGGGAVEPPSLGGWQMQFGCSCAAFCKPRSPPIWHAVAHWCGTVQERQQVRAAALIHTRRY